MSVLDRIFTALNEKGGAMYGGEAVTQLQHALQCAEFAMDEDAGDALVCAALLHDFGHLVADDEGAAACGVDMLHEEIAARWLGRWFAPAVTEPVRLHVAAKRYLCAVDKDYFASLSPASVASLKVQGGPFDGGEAAEFIAGAHGPAAVRLRRWDDLAKDPDAKTRPLDFYRETVRRCLVAGREDAA